jgi:ketosteroid isomerase-like protein
MSEEKVELVRRSVDAFNRADLDGVLGCFAPDAVVDWSNSLGFDAEVFRGRGEIRASMERFRTAFDDIRLELIGDPVEVEDGLVVMENVAYLRGRDGIEVRARSAWLIRIRDGEQTSLTLYQTKEEALEAAALSENVELSLELNDAWNRRDVDAVVALWDPEGVWYPALEGVTEGRTYRGHAGIRQYFEDLAEFSGQSDAEFPEVHDLGDQVLGLGSAWFRFASGVELDQEVAFLHTWRNGKCIEARTWLSHAEALQAAGLSE